MKSQKERVYEYIEEFGSINTLEAFKDLGVTRLSAVIFELRKLYDIADEWIYGTGAGASDDPNIHWKRNVRTGYTEYYDEKWNQVTENSVEDGYKATGIITESEGSDKCESMHIVVSNMKDEEIYSLVVEKAKR